MTLMCVADYECRRPGYHQLDCPGIECAGCMPRLAADGLRLCSYHTARIAADARRAATEVYPELEARLASGGSGALGVSVSGSKETGIRLNQAAIRARTAIREILIAWAKLVIDERGFTAPEDSIAAIGEFIAVNATWLSAHPAAADCLDEMREIAHGGPQRVAFPTGVKVRPVSVCPGDTAEVTAYGDRRTRLAATCSGQLRAIIRPEGSRRRSEIICDHDDGHRWEVGRAWLTLGATLEACGIEANLSWKADE